MDPSFRGTISARPKDLPRTLYTGQCQIWVDTKTNWVKHAFLQPMDDQTAFHLAQGGAHPNNHLPELAWRCLDLGVRIPFEMVLEFHLVDGDLVKAALQPPEA